MSTVSPGWGTWLRSQFSATFQLPPLELVQVSVAPPAPQTVRASTSTVNHRRRRCVCFISLDFFCCQFTIGSIPFRPSDRPHWTEPTEVNTLRAASPPDDRAWAWNNSTERLLKLVLLF